MKKLNIDTLKYFNSGISCEGKFYKIHDGNIDFYEYPGLFGEYVGFNKEILKQYYFKDVEIGKNELHERIEERLWEDLTATAIYYEPLIFDEEIAIECGLIPFIYRGEEWHKEYTFKKMLAVPAEAFNFLPKLDAYQVLTHYTIAKNSCLFSKSDPEYFESVIGSKIMQKVVDTLNIN